MGKPARLRAEASPFIFASQVAGELRACPRCRSERFSQQPVATLLIYDDMPLFTEGPSRHRPQPGRGPGNLALATIVVVC